MDTNAPQDTRAATPRQFKLLRAPFSRHYDIKAGTESKTPPNAFIVDISSITRHKPDLTLHAGDSLESSPAVAVCHLPKVSRTFKLGIGDPKGDPSAVVWEDVTATGFKRSEIPWSIPVPVRGGTDQRVSLAWKRTTHVAADGMDPARISGRNYKLVNLGSGEVLAVFTHQYSMSICDTIQINVDWGVDFDHAVIMTAVAIYEKKRRKNNRTSYGGAGGS